MDERPLTRADVQRRLREVLARPETAREHVGNALQLLIDFRWRVEHLEGFAERPAPLLRAIETRLRLALIELDGRSMSDE